MKTLFSFLLLFLFTLTAGSQSYQDPFRLKAAREDTICFCPKGLSLHKEVLKKRQLRALLTKYEAPAMEFKKYQVRKNLGLGVLLPGIASGVMALAKIGDGKPFLNPYTIILFSGDIIGAILMRFYSPKSVLYCLAIREHDWVTLGREKE